MLTMPYSVANASPNRSPFSVLHGESHTKLYGVWMAMKSRCRRTKGRIDYVEKGITVCSEWIRNFPVFKKWALANGYRSGLQIDRRDNDGNYSPKNCRFVTPSENMSNRSVNRMLTIRGKRKTCQQWAKDRSSAVCPGTFWLRIHRGWPPEQAFTVPAGTFLGNTAVAKRKSSQ